MIAQSPMVDQGHAQPLPWLAAAGSPQSRPAGGPVSRVPVSRVPVNRVPVSRSLVEFLTSVVNWNERARQRAEVSALSDHLLRDIGVPRNRMDS